MTSDDDAPKRGAGRAEHRSDQELFEQYAAQPTRRMRNELVERHMGLAHHIARRYSRRGVSDDDLRQVAFLALVKAVERFDTERGVAFSTFAGRTIDGEIKRHFRDATWAIHVPRPMQERHLAVRHVSDDLRQELGRVPTPADVARRLEISVDDVIEALAASAAYTATSLDGPAPEGSKRRGPEWSTTLVSTGDASGEVTTSVLLQELVGGLPERERQIVGLRFFGQLTQSEIAERLGISQMHVSRLLQKSFDRMRQAAGTDEFTQEGPDVDPDDGQHPPRPVWCSPAPDNPPNQ